MFAFACVYRHRFMRILTLAHTYIGVALYGRRREAMPVYVWGVRLMRVMQIMQVMQYLFSHTRAYILKRRGGKGIMFSYNSLVFSLSDDSLFLPTLQATACGVLGIFSFSASSKRD